MPRYALIFGSALVLLGLGGFLATGARAVTALIPAFVGLPLVVLGVVGLRGSERSRRHSMHAAVLLALLGFAGAAPGLIGLTRLLGGGDVKRPAAAVMQSAMALVCLAFVALGVRSFLSARAQRRQSTD
jgi:hypothetical protein